MNAGAFNLMVSSVPWNLFGTLTFRSEASENKARIELDRFMRWVAHVNGQKFRDLVWLGRLERGEAGHRLHLHLLIVVFEARLTYFVLRAPLVSRAHREWRLGMTKFRRVEVEGDPAVPYILEDISGADVYELGKTDRARHLVVSKGLWRIARLTSKGALRVVSCNSESSGPAGRMNQSAEHTGGPKEAA